MINTVRHYSEAEALLLTPASSLAMISITEPGRYAPLGEGYGRLLRVQFCDAEFDREMLERKGVSAEDLFEKGFPCKAKILEVLDFIAEVQGDDSISGLVVHCHAGQRRSVAVARFVSERIGSEPTEAYQRCNGTVYDLLCNPALFDDLPSRAPSRGVVAWLLGRR